MTKFEILELVEKVHNLKKGKENALPDNSYFLDEDTVLCYSRKYGDSRYPYHNDGLVMFAHTSGDVQCIDGMLTVFKGNEFSEEANTGFFVGEKFGDEFMPVSVTGANCQLYENDIERYTIFTPVCAYYITESKNGVYAVRVHVDNNKHLRFSLAAVNTGEAREIYLSSYFAPMLKCSAIFEFMNTFGEHFDCGGYIIKNRRGEAFDFVSANLAITGNVTKKYFTTAKRTVLGRKGANLSNAPTFKSGSFELQVPKTNSSDVPVMADMVHFALPEGGFAQLEYEMLVTKDSSAAYDFIGNPIDGEKENAALAERKEAERKIFDATKIQFGDWHNDNLNNGVINKFLKNVQRQVSLCALGKNYVGAYLGIRDVFQQLESALIWQPNEARAQFVRVLDYMLDDGRPPRQISFPTADDPIPPFDLRPFIDQGFWIIAALHTSLAFTNDLSVLDEVCGYYKAESGYLWGGRTPRSDISESLLDHLIRITDFLLSNVDDKTHCVHALYGDWNDALNGLGKTKRKDTAFGNGVSVMATLQLYLSLEQMIEILDKVGKYPDVAEKYRSIRATVSEGLIKNALAHGEDGSARMIHGWGEDMSYFVGSYNDYDSQSRISLAANSYCAISGFVKEIAKYKDDIAKNILSLDSKCGLLTFDKPFYDGIDKVGRICYITPGTYENACAYVHAGTFGIMALFLMGYSREAWRLLEKAMVISHENPSRTTFVMPNSYCASEEYNIDGDSTGDWYTGSGTVLIKEIVKCGFGIEPNLSSLKISPTDYFPCKNAEITLKLKGCDLRVRYENRGEGKRKIYLGDKELPLTFDSVRNNYYAEIADNELLAKTEILITD